MCHVLGPSRSGCSLCRNSQDSKTGRSSKRSDTFFLSFHFCFSFVLNLQTSFPYFPFCVLSIPFLGNASYNRNKAMHAQMSKHGFVAVRSCWKFEALHWRRRRQQQQPIVLVVAPALLVRNCLKNLWNSLVAPGLYQGVRCLVIPDMDQPRCRLHRDVSFGACMSNGRACCGLCWKCLVCCVATLIPTILMVTRGKKEIELPFDEEESCCLYCWWHLEA